MNELAPIVVGIDGGEASVAALELAVREAGFRQAPIIAMTCWPSSDRHDDAGPLLCSSYAHAAELLEHVIRQVKARTPHSIPIFREIVKDDAGNALVSASRHVELLILGSTTRGHYGRRHGRKTIEHCLLYAEAPVVVVPWTEASLDELDIDIDLHQATSR